MNYEQNEIDDIFKNGLEHNSTPYKNEYWNLMEEMLDEKRPSVYGFAYKKWLSYVGLTSLVLVMLLIGNGTNDSRNIIAKSNNGNTQFIYPIVNYTHIIQNQKQIQSTQTKSSQNSGSIVSKNISTENISKNNYTGNNTSNFNTENFYKNIENLFASENITPIKNETINNKFEDNRISYFRLNTIAYQNFITENKADKTQNKKVGINTSLIEKNEINTADKNIPKSKDEKLKPTKKAKATQTNKTNKTEVVSVANLDLHILGGLTYGNSFNTNNTKNKNNTGIMAGLGFGYYFNNKLSLSIDVMYQKRNGHELERKVTSEEFFLYKKSSTYTLKTFGTDYLVLPIQMRYQVKKHHAVSLGLYTNFLLNSYNTIYTSVSANNTTNIEAADDMVNYGAWETVNYGYTISYEYNPNKKIGIGIGYYKGMKDATINSFYRNDKKDLMSDFNINLKYYLK